MFQIVSHNDVMLFFNLWFISFTTISFGILSTRWYIMLWIYIYIYIYKASSNMFSNKSTCNFLMYFDFYFVYMASNIRTFVGNSLYLVMRTFSQTIDNYSTFLTTWTCIVSIGNQPIEKVVNDNCQYIILVDTLSAHSCV